MLDANTLDQLDMLQRLSSVFTTSTILLGGCSAVANTEVMKAISFPLFVGIVERSAAELPCGLILVTRSRYNEDAISIMLTVGTGSANQASSKPSPILISWINTNWHL
jgi:hypothetical protein